MASDKPANEPHGGHLSLGPGPSLIIDPAALTIQMVWRETGSLKELIMARLQAIELAVTVAHEDLVRFPTEVQKQVATLKEVHSEKFNAIELLHRHTVEIANEKFRGIQVQFQERDVRAEQSLRDSKTAVDAALQAAKEAVSEQNKSSSMAIGKSESATAKQIDQLAILINTTSNALESKIIDLKERLTRIESLGEGAKGAVTTQQAAGGYSLAIAGFVVGIIGLVAGVAISLLTR